MDMTFRPRVFVPLLTAAALSASVIAAPLSHADTSDAPVRQILDNTNGLDPFGLATDSAGRLYVANIGVGVEVFGPTADGDVVPSTMLTGLPAPTGVAIAADQGVWVSYIDCTVQHFAPLGDSPDQVISTPVASFAGTADGLSACQGITVDDVGGFVYLSGGGFIAQFDMTDATAGATPPTPAANHVISVAGRMLGLSLDPQRRVVTADGNDILAFDADATVGTPPAWTLTVGPGATGAAFDGAGRIFVGLDLFAGPGSVSNPYAIQVFAAGATGSATPIASIRAESTGTPCDVAWATDPDSEQCVASFVTMSWDGATFYSTSALRTDGNRVLAVSVEGLGLTPAPRTTQDPSQSDPTDSSNQPAPSNPSTPTTDPVATPTPTPTPEAIAPAPSAQPVDARIIPASTAARTASVPGGGSMRAQGPGRTCIEGTCITGSRWTVSVCVPKGAKVTSPGAKAVYTSGSKCAADEQLATITANRQPPKTSRIVVKQGDKAVRKITVRTRT